jgi:hypothetical protein
MPKISQKSSSPRPALWSKMKIPLNFQQTVIDDKLVIEIDVPGMSSTGVKVSIYEDFVSIAGSRCGVQWNDPIPVDPKIYDLESCSAFFKDCVLQLVFTKLSSSTPTIVTILTSDDVT